MQRRRKGVFEGEKVLVAAAHWKRRQEEKEKVETMNQHKIKTWKAPAPPPCRLLIHVSSPSYLSHCSQMLIVREEKEGGTQNG